MQQHQFRLLHFTLNKKPSGADHAFALEPDELALMVKEIRAAEKWGGEKRNQFLDSRSFYKEILGSGQKIIAPSEKDIYPGDKRSIFAIKNIKKGNYCVVYCNSVFWCRNSFI